MRLILKDIRQWRLRLDALRFGILTLVVVLFWMGIELFTTYDETTIPQDYTQSILPLSPTLDLEVLRQVENRIKIDEAFTIIKEEIIPASESGDLN